jgi:hypothetical protein
MVKNRQSAGSILVAATLGLLLPLRGAAQDDAGKELEPLAWAVGGSWLSELQNADGKPLPVYLRFQWAENHRAIHYTIVFEVEGKKTPHYDGTYYWHPAKKSIALLQIDRHGNVVESTVTPEGKTLKQENVQTSIDGTQRPQRVEITQTGNDSFTTKAFIQRDGKWVEVASFTYKRNHEKTGG